MNNQIVKKEDYGHIGPHEGEPTDLIRFTKKLKKKYIPNIVINVH